MTQWRTEVTRVNGQWVKGADSAAAGLGGSPGIALRRPDGARRRRAFRARRGLNIFDNLWGIALVAIGVLLVAAGGFEAFARWKENRGAYLQSQLVNAVTATYRSTRDYGTGSLIGNLDVFKRLPEAFVVRSGGTTTIEHPWGGDVVVTGSPGGASNQFRVRFNDLDDDVCAAMAEVTAGLSRSKSGIDEVRINGTLVDLPYDVSDITGACNGGDAGNWVAWDYF